MITTLFKWLVLNCKCHFINKTPDKTFIPFRQMETQLEDGRFLKFSIAKSRRKKSLIQRLFLVETYLVYAEIHEDISSKLDNFNNLRLIIMNAPFGQLFSDSVTGEVLLNIYLDRMIHDLQYCELCGSHHEDNCDGDGEVKRIST